MVDQRQTIFCERIEFRNFSFFLKFFSAFYSLPRWREYTTIAVAAKLTADWRVFLGASLTIYPFRAAHSVSAPIPQVEGAYL